jgi:hypothetical protein
LETGNRITLGASNEFNSVSKRGLMEIGYNYILSTAYLTPTYNLFDFGAGLSAVFIWDDIGQFEIPAVGFTLNVPIKIYAPGIKAAGLYVETDIRMVMYTGEYPSNGTWLNAGYNDYREVNFFGKDLFDSLAMLSKPVPPPHVPRRS